MVIIQLGIFRDYWGDFYDSAWPVKHFRTVALKPNKDLSYINELFEAGKVKPVIDGPYHLYEVPEALRMFGKGEHKGKIVITMQ